MRFQSKTSVFKFLLRTVDAASLGDLGADGKTERLKAVSVFFNLF